MKKFFIFLMAMFLSGSGSFHVFAEPSTRAMDEVLAKSNEIISVLGQHDNPRQRLAAIKPILMELFDFQYIAKRCAKVPKEDMAEYMELFPDFILAESALFGKIVSSSWGKVERSDQKVIEGVTIVTEVISIESQKNVEAHLRMHEKNDCWKAYDVFTTGVGDSLVTYYQTELGKYLSGGSAKKLIAHMRYVIDKDKQGIIASGRQK